VDASGGLGWLVSCSEWLHKYIHCYLSDCQFEVCVHFDIFLLYLNLQKQKTDLPSELNLETEQPSLSYNTTESS
jgi:hypothetical protein